MNIESIKEQVEAVKASTTKNSKADRAKFNKILEVTNERKQRSFKGMLRALKGRVYALPLVGSFVQWCVMLLRIHVRIKQQNERLAEILVLQGRQSARLKFYINNDASPRFDYLTHYLSVVRNEIADLQSKFANISQRPNITAAASVVNPENIDLGMLYVSFEERFRASPDALLCGFEGYRGYLEAMPARLKTLPCLDVGCGRGEWLSYVRQLGFKVVGVDSNAAMVEVASAQGIESYVDDGITFLAKQKSGSMSVISAFHVVEHLPLGALLRLLEESYRVLAQGGVAIFETPNPENIFVGACNFYTDPTHRNPIPPHTLDFLVLQKGFAKTEVVRKGVNEIPVSSTDPAVNYILEWFRKEQDYAIVAFKI